MRIGALRYESLRRHRLRLKPVAAAAPTLALHLGTEDSEVLNVLLAQALVAGGGLGAPGLHDGLEWLVEVPNR